MTGYRMHKQYSIIRSTQGYITSDWAHVLQVYEITRSTSFGSD